MPLAWLSWLPIVALSGAYYDYSNWYGQDQSEFHFVKLAVIWFITEESLRWECQLYYYALNCNAVAWLCMNARRSVEGSTSKPSCVTVHDWLSTYLVVWSVRAEALLG